MTNICPAYNIQYIDFSLYNDYATCSHFFAVLDTKISKMARWKPSPLPSCIIGVFQSGPQENSLRSTSQGKLLKRKQTGHSFRELGQSESGPATTSWWQS
jgi:hypothetical protein